MYLKDMLLTYYIIYIYYDYIYTCALKRIYICVYICIDVCTVYYSSIFIFAVYLFASKNFIYPKTERTSASWHTHWSSLPLLPQRSENLSGT